jgi:hypothetical protein
MTLDLQKNSLKFLFILISADLLFFLFHIGHLVTTDAIDLAAQNRSPFVLGKDLGLAEAYQYVKEYWIILLLTYMAWDKRKFVFVSWAILFVFILTDDMLQVHEQAGYLISGWLEILPAYKLRANDYGELIFEMAVGLIFLTILVVPYLFSDRKVKQICHHFVVLLGVLVFFGVFFDMLHVMFDENVWMFNVLGFIEDGGEMITISVFCWYVYLLSDPDIVESPIDIL